MQISHSITIDLLEPRKNVIHVVQDDSTRQILLTLLSGGVAYNVSADLAAGEKATGVVSFRKPDGHTGCYDTANLTFDEHTVPSGGNPKALGLYELVGYSYIQTNDTEAVAGKTYYEGEGTTAVETGGATNKWLVHLDGQCFTCSGTTMLNVSFFTENGKLLSTFIIEADVHPNPAISVTSGSYYNLQSIADLREALAKCVRFDAQSLSADERDQARRNIGAMEASNMPSFRMVSSPLFDVTPPAGSSAPDVFISVDRANGKLSVAKDDENDPDVVIEGVGAPESANDAANKAYVDAQIAAIDIETDVSDAYAAAEQQDPTLTPLAYLAALPAGRYKMYAGGSNYRAENIPIADSSTYVTSEIKEVTDEGFSHRYVYNDGRREVAVFEEGGTHYHTPLSAQRPVRDIEVVPRGFLMEKLAPPFAGENAYRAGDYCTHDGGLYRAKQDIAAGLVWDAALWDEVTVGGELEEMDRQQKDMLGNIAADYDSTKTYSAGAYCMQDEKLYRCVIPIPTPEAWTAAHWEEVTVGQAMRENKEYIDAVASTLKFETWGDLQKIVRAGLANKVLEVGDQLTCERAGDELVWDVLGIDIDTPADSQFTHSVTIGLHDCLADLQFDAREALFYFADGLAAGTYKFTVKDHSWVSGDINKTFQFTLTREVPAKGQFVLDVAYNVTIANSTAKTYASATSATAIETVTITEGSEGTDLGDVNNGILGGTNSLQRALRGNNNYSQSALRQYLNSKADAGSVWGPKNAWDRMPAWNDTTNGFLNGMDEDFLAVIGEVTKKTALNTVSDGGGSATTTEKVFLLSRSEVYGGDEVTGGEGAAYPYFSDHSDLGSAGMGNDANRIKYRNGDAQYWWLRSPLAGTAAGMRVVYTTGYLASTSYFAHSFFGIVPACCII